MTDYDVIVIGAGNGGLTAAASLARRGVKVMLLEKHNVPGGCATSFIRGRFEFETSLHQLSGLGTPQKPGPLRGLLHRLGVLEKVEFVQDDTLYRTVAMGVGSITLNADKADTIAMLKAMVPEEATAIDSFFDLVWQFCNQMISVHYLHDPMASKARYPIYFKYALKTFQDVLDEYFVHPGLKGVVASYWGYAGLPPARLSFTTMAFIIWSYIEFKPFHIKGGSQALSNALLDTFLEAGGEVRFNCAAKKILTKNDCICGVRIQDGTDITCRFVISNASTLTTYVDLLCPEDIPPEKMQMLGSRNIGPSIVTVYCGLACKHQDLGIEVSTEFVSTNPEADAETHFAGSRTLEPPIGCQITCYNVANPDFSPPGTCEVVIASLQYAEHWYSIPPAQYAETKYRFAQELLNIAEALHPGFIDALEEVEVSSPITHLRYLGHPGGAVYGFEQYPKDSNLFVSSLSGIEGLHFAGSWVGAGGYEPTLTSGVAASDMVYAKLSEVRT